MPPAQKPAGAEGAERALPREQPVTADAATPTPANKGSASAAGAEIITMGNDDLLRRAGAFWSLELLPNSDFFLKVSCEVNDNLVLDPEGALEPSGAWSCCPIPTSF